MKKEKLIAVIDIGSHSIKMHIGEILKKNDIKHVEYLWAPVAIGKDIFSKGMVSNSTILDVTNAINNFKEVLDSYQIKNFKAFSSSVIKEADNSDVLLERVFKTTGIRINIIEPIEETEVIYEGIKNVLKERYGFQDKNVLILAIGGGSTQIVMQSKGRIIFSETHHIGSLRMVRNNDFNGKSYQFTLKPFSLSFLNTMKRFPDIKNINGFVALNDDILVILQNVFNDFLIKGVFKIPRKEFNRIYYQIDSMSLEKIREKFQLNDNVLKTTKVAFLMLGIFFNLTSAKFILIPNISTSYFLLYKLAFLYNKNKFPDKNLRDNILSSAMAIGRKYQFDKEHALQVYKLSLMIFDKLQEIYGFGNRERLYLEVASILHDIGVFVSAGNHHKHSAQLIVSAEIMGLQQNDMKIISQIARYHRKSPPKPSHFDYNELQMEDRLIVSRLASILRVGDALDNTHTQVVEDLKLNIDEEKIEISVKLKDNLFEYMDILKEAVQKKSDLFEGFFGISVRLEKWL